MNSSDLNAESQVVAAGAHMMQLLSFSPDSRWLVMDCGESELLLWHARLDDLIAAGRYVAGRSLSPAERRQFGINR
jgi:hypothetical protein